MQQGKGKGHEEFPERLKKMGKCLELNTEEPLGQGMLKLHLVTNIWLDIAGELQNAGGEGVKGQKLVLLREIQKVYGRKDEEKQKKDKNDACRLLQNKLSSKAGPRHLRSKSGSLGLLS